MSVDDARRVIDEARAAGVFPAATVEIGSSAAPIWSDAFGTDARTPFDLASLTKVISTTSVVMELVRTGALGLEEPVSAFFGEWRGGDREQVTVRDLLEHASGLPARLVDAPPIGRREFEHDICKTPLEYAPRTRSIYSDLGFILLGFLAADRGGAPLAELFDRITVRLPPDLLTFLLPPAARGRAAPTHPMDEDTRRGRTLVGEVHDNYAASLGGIAGHAGLFGNASGVGAFARAVLRAARDSTERETSPKERETSPKERGTSPKERETSPEERGTSPKERGTSPKEREPFRRAYPEPFSPTLVREFTAKSTVPGSSRALGWDTMLPTSSCGLRMSPRAFGHVGYTGTSLWIDPVRDRYFVVLANRVYGGGTPDDMRAVRRAFHDALGDV